MIVGLRRTSVQYVAGTDRPMRSNRAAPSEGTNEVGSVFHPHMGIWYYASTASAIPFWNLFDLGILRMTCADTLSTLRNKRTFSTYSWVMAFMTFLDCGRKLFYVLLTYSVGRYLFRDYIKYSIARQDSYASQPHCTRRPGAPRLFKLAP